MERLKDFAQLGSAIKETNVLQLNDKPKKETAVEPMERIANSLERIVQILEKGKAKISIERKPRVSSDPDISLNKKSVTALFDGSISAAEAFFIEYISNCRKVGLKKLTSFQFLDHLKKVKGSGNGEEYTLTLLFTNEFLAKAGLEKESAKSYVIIY